VGRIKAMIRDDEHTRLLGELHRALSASVPKKDYDILVNCLRSCRNAVEEAVLTLEKGAGKREATRTAKNLRIFLGVLNSHVEDKWITQNVTPVDEANKTIREHFTKRRTPKPYFGSASD